MLEILRINLINSGIGALFFIAAYIANMLLSLQYNVRMLREPFDKKKIFDSFFKVGSIVVGTILLIIIITSLPLFMTSVGVPIPEEYIGMFSIIVIIGGFLSPTLKYTKESLDKWNKILGSGIVSL